MGRRSPNPQRIKTLRPYRVDEIVRTLKVHKNTVLNWRTQGLEVVDEHRPILIRGAVLRAFLQKRRDKVRRRCPPGYFYCFRCRAPRRPAGDMVDYIPDSPTAKKGNLRAICSGCDGWINQRSSEAKLVVVRKHLDVQVQQAQPRLSETT